MNRFFLTLVLIFLTLDLLWWIYARRRFAGTGSTHRRLRWLTDFISIGSILTLLLLIGSRAIHMPIDAIMPRILVIFTFIWHLFALPVAIAILTLHGTTRAAKALFEVTRKNGDANAGSSSQPPEDRPPTRRDFLARAGAFAPALVSGAGTAYAASTLSTLRVRELQVRLANLPSSLDGLTIAHVSDTHLGRFTDAATFRRIVTHVNDLDADLILHTGDLINDDQSLLPPACQLVREMKARHGTFLCEGNHDLIEGRESFYESMRREQMPLLIDQIQSVQVNGHEIELLGLPWTRGGRTGGADAAIAEGVNRLAGRRSIAAFPILLAHHPHAFDAAVENGIPLTLGGHTHGGQLNLTDHIGFGPAMYRYWSGLYSRAGCHTFISNGAGNWFPIRMNAPAEIARITLRRLPA